MLSFTSVVSERDGATLEQAEGCVLLPLPDTEALSCCCDEFIGVCVVEVEGERGREPTLDDELFTDRSALTREDLERWCLFGNLSEPLMAG